SMGLHGPLIGTPWPLPPPSLTIPVEEFQLQSTALWLSARALRSGAYGWAPAVCWRNRAMGLSPSRVWAHTTTSYTVPAVRFDATHTHTHAHTRTQAHTHTHTHTQTHTHTHTNAQAHTHTH